MVVLLLAFLTFFGLCCAAVALAFTERARLRTFDPRAFGRGWVVFRSVRDLRELGGHVTPPLCGTILTSRAARFMMVAADEGFFLARATRGDNPGQYVVLGTFRVQGLALLAEGRLSPWIATSCIGPCVIFLIGFAISFVWGEDHAVFLGGFSVLMLAMFAGSASLWIRNARHDAELAVDDLAAILVERWDMARPYPDAE